jgi:hypothetical protein
VTSDEHKRVASGKWRVTGHAPSARHSSLVTRHFLFVLALLPCCVLHAQNPQPPLFTLHAADGAFLEGPLEGIKEDWSVSLGGDKGKLVPGADVLSLRRRNAVLPPAPAQEHVVLANGDRIAGKLLQTGNDGARVQAELGMSQEIRIPSTSILVWWLTVPDGVSDADLFRRRLVTERRRRDVALLRNGDRVEGTLLGVDGNGARLKTGAGKDVAIGRDKLAALALNTVLARGARRGAAYGRVILANGSRVSLLSAHTSNQLLIGKTVFGAEVTISVAQLAALSLHQGRAVYLSDLKPLRYEHIPYLGLAWPYTIDASVAGRDLSVGGSVYDKGIGMHSESRLAYDLGGAYRSFESLVGLDDQTGREGSAVIEVLVDGKPQTLGEPKEITLQGGPRLIQVNITGAKELTLVVKFARRGDVQAHVDWADAKLIK